MSYPMNASLIIIIIKYEKQLLLLKKNHRFDLRDKIKNYMNLSKTCLILLFLLLIIFLKILLLVKKI
jgi:hypothetical protein